MTKDEIQKAMIRADRILYNNTEYNYISAIIYRRFGSQIRTQIELMDKNQRSVIVVDPRKIKVKET